MTTKTVFEIRQVDHDGIRTWYAMGKVDPREFLLALLEQFNEEVTERVRDNCRVPKLADVSHTFGMAAECMDGYWVEKDTHNDICEDPETCDFDIEQCKWQTFVYDEALIVETSPLVTTT